MKKKVSKKTPTKKSSKKNNKKVTKSAVKKRAVKTTKKAKKKSTIISVTKQLFGEAPEHQYFILKDGSHLRSVQELAEALEHMNEDIFKHHVDDERNDFANWVEDVFNNKDLGQELREAHNQIEARIKLLQKLVNDVISEAKKKSR